MFGIVEVLTKLTLAAVAGLLLGLEREAKHKPLGLKTCAIISIASCLLTIISIESALHSYNGSMFIRADPMRLAAQIISGVGFLGAGVILRRNNDVISGLTTAAIVWAASGFGIAIGAGYYIQVAIAITLMFCTISFLPYVMRKIGPHSLKEQELLLKVFVDSSVDIKLVVSQIEKQLISVKSIKIKGDNDGHRVEMRCFIDDEKDSVFRKYDRIRMIDGVNQVEIAGV